MTADLWLILGIGIGAILAFLIWWATKPYRETQELIEHIRARGGKIKRVVPDLPNCPDPPEPPMFTELKVAEGRETSEGIYHAIAALTEQNTEIMKEAFNSDIPDAEFDWGPFIENRCHINSLNEIARMKEISEVVVPRKEDYTTEGTEDHGEKIAKNSV